LILGPGKERKEGFSRWSRTLFEFKRAPMTVIWGVQDPVAVIAMADRIGDAIIARLGSL
jgi:hypothetical protein